MLFLRNEFFKNFLEPFYDDVIYRNDTYLSTNEEMRGVEAIILLPELTFS